MNSSSAAPVVVHVDDNRADALVVRRTFEQLPQEVNVVSLGSGQELLQWLMEEDNRDSCLLILLDLKLPGMSGQEAIAKLKQDRQLARIPVVVLSGSGRPGDVEGAYDQGANAYIIKPGDPARWRARLGAILDVWGGIPRGLAHSPRPPQEPLAAASGSNDGDSVLPPLKVMVVDDAAGDAGLLTRSLEGVSGLNVQARVFKDGASAIAGAAEGAYDIVFMDYRLPDMSGLEAVGAMGEHIAETGIVLLTGYGAESVAADALRLGIDDYVHKSELGPERLEQAIHRCLEKIQSRRTVRIDRLTGLHTRAALEGRLAEELNRCQRYGGRFSLLLIDLDDFKPINDSYGHTTGDDLLRQVGRHFRDNLREVDFAARYGGDEFCIIMPEASAPEAVEVAVRIQTELPSVVFDCGKRHYLLKVGCSIGIAEFSGSNPINVETALQMADDAMYRVKAAGGNSVSVYNKADSHSG